MEQQTPERDWRQKRWPIPPELLKVFQVQIWETVKKPSTSATQRKAALKLLRDINELRRER